MVARTDPGSDPDNASNDEHPFCAVQIFPVDWASYADSAVFATNDSAVRWLSQEVHTEHRLARQLLLLIEKIVKGPAGS